MWHMCRLPSVSQVLHLEIDYHSLKKQSIRAEVKDVAHMEEQLSNVSAKMEVRYRVTKKADHVACLFGRTRHGSSYSTVLWG